MTTLPTLPNLQVETSYETSDSGDVVCSVRAYWENSSRASADMVDRMPNIANDLPIGLTRRLIAELVAPIEMMVRQAYHEGFASAVGTNTNSLADILTPLETWASRALSC